MDPLLGERDGREGKEREGRGGDWTGGEEGKDASLLSKILYTSLHV